MSKHRWRNASFLGCFVLSILLIFLLISAPAPHLFFEYRGETIDISADRAWVWQPGSCLQVSWILDDMRTIHIEGIERTESGAEEFCPAINRSSPKIELTDYFRDVYRSYELDTYYLPDFLLNLAGVAGLALFGVIALYYLWTNDLEHRPSPWFVLLMLTAMVLCIALLRLSGLELTIVGVLATLRNLFQQRNWQLFGGVLAVMLYVPLIIRAMRVGFKRKRSADLVVIGGFLIFISLLYLPFGFLTIGHWEEWHGRAYLEGARWAQASYASELSGRFWLFVPHTLAYLISADSFHGFNLLYALFLWGRLAIFYGILRQLSVRSLFAFLITMLFAVYPVDSGLMSLRSIGMQFSFLSLLTAAYLSMHYLKEPKRQCLIGLWLAILLCVGVVESGYALILIVPLLWWYRQRQPTWRNLNLTVIWYLFPAFKFAYMSLLFFAGRAFYRSNYVYRGNEISFEGLFSTTFENLLNVYWQSIVNGWVDACSSMWRNPWLPLTFVALALIAAIAWFLWRSDDDDWIPSRRRLGFTLLIGLLLVLPSVGVLIWLEEYSRELWRLYLYVPIPAAIVVFSLITLLTMPITNIRYRNALIIVLCLLLMLPGLSRLILQHEYFVTSANNKAQVLAEIVKLAPEIENRTRVIVLSDMPADELKGKYIEEMESNMIGSALYVIYGSTGSGRGKLCPSVHYCLTVHDWEKNLADTMVFLLHNDLTLELVEQPATIFDAFKNVVYNVTDLYNPHAPVPPRAVTMLGLATQ